MMKKNFRTISIFVVAILICNMAVVYAEVGIWQCENCGTENTTKFCGECGTAKASWVCVSCGEKNTENKCASCGISKKESTVKNTYMCTAGAAVYNYFDADNSLHVYTINNPEKLHVDDYSDDCRLHPHLEVENLTDSPQTPVISAICNGESFSFEEDTLDSWESDGWYISSVCMSTPGTSYETEWFVDGVSVAKDSCVVVDGNSNFYHYLHNAFSYSAILNIRNNELDIDISRNIQTGRTSQLAEHETFYLQFHANERDKQFLSSTERILFPTFGLIPCEIDAILNYEDGIYFSEEEAMYLSQYNFNYRRNFNYKSGLNEVIFYINGIEVLRDTFEIIIDTE